MGRILFLLILVICIYFLGRSIFAPRPPHTSGRERGRANKAPLDTELVQDPQCQLYIPRAEAVRRSIRGRTYHFCSRECADKFERA